MKDNYVFTLEEDFVYDTYFVLTKKYSIKDKNGNIVASIDRNGRLKIFAGYSWDGCSPKFNILDLKIIGTPDGIINQRTGKPKTYYASMVHDMLYQFQPQIKKEVTRKQADKVFLGLMGKFKLRYIYYFVVRLAGWAWWIT